MLEIEYEFFQKNRDQYVKEHRNEWAVIQGEKLIGFFVEELDAFKAMKDHELGTYMVKQCIPEEDEVHFYHSRVALG